MIQNGIPKDLLILILMVPVVATLIAFLREIVGVKGFGVYTSLIISFAFVGTGLVNGTLLFILVLLTGTGARLFIRKLRLLYLPRIAIILTAVAFTIFITLAIAAFYRQGEILKISIFPIIIILTLVEKFIAAQIERGARTALTLTLETYILASFSYFIINWGWLRAQALAWPFVIFGIALIANIILGKWTGLRLTELIRFREIIRYVELSSKK